MSTEVRPLGSVGYKPVTAIIAVGFIGLVFLMARTVLTGIIGVLLMALAVAASVMIRDFPVLEIYEDHLVLSDPEKRESVSLDNDMIREWQISEKDRLLHIYTTDNREYTLPLTRDIKTFEMMNRHYSDKKRRSPLFDLGRRRK